LELQQLLLTRMEALQVNPDEVRRMESDVFADFAEACANCDSKVSRTSPQQAQLDTIGGVIVPMQLP